MTYFKKTIDFKKLAELIAPEKHLCIKYKQQLANAGIVCDDCITKLVNMISEFNSSTVSLLSKIRPAVANSMVFAIDRDKDTTHNFFVTVAFLDISNLCR
jgi:hypothetical protein